MSDSFSRNKTYHPLQQSADEQLPIVSLSSLEGDTADLLSLSGNKTNPSINSLRPVLAELKSDDILINRHKIIREIGKGGMGCVYLAMDTWLNQEIAIKLIRPEFTQREDLKQRFLQETKARILRHDGIVQIYDIAESAAHGCLFLTMEYIKGQSLAELLKPLHDQHKFVGMKLVISVMQQIANAIDYAHSMGIIHRDLKPGNILVAKQADGSLKTKIIDFGLIKLQDQDLGLSQSGTSLGTLHYMSPEQQQSAGKVDHRTDIYSLGMILYELLTGPLSLIGHLESPSEIRSELPINVDSIWKKAIARNPNNRYQSGSEMSRDIYQAINIFLELREKELRVLSEQGEILIKNQDYSNAIKQFDKAIEISTENANLYSKRGICHKNMSNFLDAISDFTYSIVLDETDARVFYLRSSCWKALENIECAIEDLNKAIELKPDSTHLLTSRAEYWKILERFQLAVSDYSEAIRLDDKNSQYYLFRGDAWYILEQYENAIQDYTVAITLEPDEATLYSCRAKCSKRIKDYNQAISDFTEAIRLNIKAEYYFERGNCFLNLENEELALKDFTEALSLEPENPKYQRWITDYCRGFELYELAELAIKYLNIVILRFPSNEDFYKVRAECWYKIENYEKAYQDYSLLIKLNEKNAFYYFWRGNCSQYLRNYKQAIDDYEIAIILRKDNSVFFFEKAKCFDSLRNYSQAISDLSEAILLQPNKPDYYEYRAMCYESKSDFISALHDYEEILRILPKLDEDVVDEIYINVDDIKEKIDYLNTKIQCK